MPLIHNNNLKAEKDSRKHPRRPCKKPLIVTYKNRHIKIKALATDISRGGAFIETGSKISLGARIILVIHGSKNHKGVRLRGWIVRLSPQGVGVSFDRRSGRERRYDLDRRTGLERRKKVGKPQPGTRLKIDY
jgi:Tfp pilus assembly protein PilZ